MRRRFLQFSLRGLLGFALLVCLLLGGWHLLETYGNRLDVEARVGFPIRVRVRYFRVFGPPQCDLEIMYRTADGSRIFDGTDTCGFSNRIARSWLCLYSIEHEFDPIDRPCQLVVSSFRWELLMKDVGRTDRNVQRTTVDVK